ncbi:MAG: hypothetical protein ABSG62_10110 [Terracidiphilus sp.]
MRMKSVGEIGLKITAAQREYFRYSGASAELERRGAGTSRPDLAWVRRSRQLRGEVCAEPEPSSGSESPNRS